MRKLLSALCLMVVSVPSLAQIVDLGVIEARDEFTLVGQCSQLVFNSDDDHTGIILTLIDGRVVVIIEREVGDSSQDFAFDLSGLVGGERVYFRFSVNDIVNLEPADVYGLVGVVNLESAVFMDSSLAKRLTAAPNDIRVRFDGPRGQVDFTINHGVAVALAEGFGKTCFPQ